MTSGLVTVNMWHCVVLQAEREIGSMLMQVVRTVYHPDTFRDRPQLIRAEWLAWTRNAPWVVQALQSQASDYLHAHGSATLRTPALDHEASGAEMLHQQSVCTQGWASVALPVNDLTGRSTPPAEYARETIILFSTLG